MKILTKVMDLLALSVILSFMILMFSGCQMASGTLSERVGINGFLAEKLGHIFVGALLVAAEI